MSAHCIQHDAAVGARWTQSGADKRHVPVSKDGGGVCLLRHDCTACKTGRCRAYSSAFTVFGLCWRSIFVSMAAFQKLYIEDVMEILPRAWNFREITREDVQSVLCMLAGDYEHARELPVRPRILWRQTS